MATQASPARRVDRAPFDPRIMIDLRDQLQRALGAAYTIERELGGGGMSRRPAAQRDAVST